MSFWALACCDEFNDADHGYHNLAQNMRRIFCFCVEFLYIIPILLSQLSISLTILKKLVVINNYSFFRARSFKQLVPEVRRKK
jgi:hypothetical protein